MSNIIKFPKAAAAVVPVKTDEVSNAKGKTVLAGLVRFVWVATALVWPIFKYVLSIEVFFQFVRMLFHWNTPGVHAGWTFLLHFAVLTAITYFVSIYKPKGL